MTGVMTAAGDLITPRALDKQRFMGSPGCTACGRPSRFCCDMCNSFTCCETDQKLIGDMDAKHTKAWTAHISSHARTLITIWNERAARFLRYGPSIQSHLTRDRIEAHQYQAVNVSSTNVDDLRALNDARLGTPYSDAYYRELTQPQVRWLTRLLYDHLSDREELCGAISCCLEPKDGRSSSSTLYINTLAVSSAVGRRGFGTRLVEEIFYSILPEARRRGHLIRDIRLHVRRNNTAALSFYQRHGFMLLEYLEDYYDDLVPPDAFYMIRTL